MVDKTEITISSYNNNAKSFENRFMDLKLYKDTFNTLVKIIDSSESILDLGCGPGNVSKYLLNKNNKYKITGIDLSENMVSLAKENVPNAVFIQQDIRQLNNFSNDSYDVIVAAFCIPFLYDEETKDFIEQIARIVKNNGIIYISTMKGSGFKYEVPSFSNGDEFFFNYYTNDFLEKEFTRRNLNKMEYIEQDYTNKNGSILKDMIYILKKTKS